MDRSAQEAAGLLKKISDFFIVVFLAMLKNTIISKPIRILYWALDIVLRNQISVWPQISVLYAQI